MKKLFILLFGLIISANIVMAEGENDDKKSSESPALTTSFIGKVVDKLSGEVLTGVAVTIAGTNLKTYTDFDGNFSFEGVRPGNYTLETNMVSYKAVKETVNVELSSSSDVELAIESVTE